MSLPTLDATAATAALKAMTAWDTAPILTEGELAIHLALAQVEDEAGVLPDEDGYVPTYTYRSLRGAAVSVLRQKVAELSADAFDVGGGSGVEFLRSQKIANFRALIVEYGGTPGSTTVGGGVGTITLVGVGGGG